MKLNIKKPRDFINALLSRKSINSEAFQNFKAVLHQYRHDLNGQVSSKQTEPNIVTNALKPFVDSLGYVSKAHSQSGQSGIDLAVMQNNQPAVIIEAKLPNSRDMITPQDLNRKAFHEAILYFMRERARGNAQLFHIIITDFNNWFVFDAKQFDYLFWRNPSIRKCFDTYTSPTLLGDTTAEFYKALEAELPNQKTDLITEESIECAHFDLRTSHSERELVAICKLLSSDCLLKTFNPNDANSLNREFYNELLYILGLEESKEKGKKVIGRAKHPQAGTLYENIRTKLNQYQVNDDFESVIKLIIIWVNRILFLKLLESQIAKWTKSTQQQKFLHPTNLTQYDQLDTLFFEVLAKPVSQRSTREFDHIPYLNSSLFQVHEDEKAGIKISNLMDDLEIEYYSKTVVIENNKQRKTGLVSTLPYLLEFLDAYDFANDSDAEVVSSAKSLISASVLGLIFEKINGYKDGSFYTPSFITMYMAREVLERAVIDKFNEAKQWQCQSLKDVYNKSPDIGEANQIINSIRICDPAVGSGHFLVSALNEILRIKSELEVLVDENGKRLKDYSISVENDELIIKDDNGELFEYERASIEKTRIQKTLFKEKQRLIENCLFGVDINQNSVNICRLRLWVELLKNAYYKDDGTLDTLPNIDINIHCGNSLISRFGVNDDFTLKAVKHEIVEYKSKVTEYKENIGSKQAVMASIASIKGKFRANLQNSHVATRMFNNKLAVYVKEYGFDGLNNQLKLTALDLGLLGKQADMFGAAANASKHKQLKQELDKALMAVQEVESGKIYERAFEWRFEYPEVLDAQGEFVGFDVVIGNPPYFNIDTFGAGSPMLKYLPESYPDVYMDKSDILFYFIALASSISAKHTAFIISNAMLFSDKAKRLRNFLLQHNPPRKIINFERYQVFDEASVTSMMLFLEKGHSASTLVQNFPEASYSKTELIQSIDAEESFSRVQFSPDAPFALISDIMATLNQKIDGQHPKLGDVLHLGSGMQTAANKVFEVDGTLGNFDSQYIKKYMTGEIIDRYTHRPAQSHLLYVESASEFEDLPIEIQNHLLANKEQLENRAEIKRNASRKWWKYSFPMHKDFYARTKIWCSYRAKENTFCLDETTDYIGLTNTTVIFDTNPDVDIKYVLALLNSRTLGYRYRSIGKQTGGGIFEFFENQVSKLPIPLIDEDRQKPFIEMIEAIIASKQSGVDTSQLERDLEQMIYALYGLNEREISVIEAAASE